MFNLFKKKSKFDEAVYLLHNFFRMPYFPEEAVEHMRERLNNSSFTKEDAAIMLSLTFLSELDEEQDFEHLDEEAKKSIRFYLGNTIDAAYGMHRAGVKFGKPILPLLASNYSRLMYQQELQGSEFWSDSRAENLCKMIKDQLREDVSVEEINSGEWANKFMDRNL